MAMWKQNDAQEWPRNGTAPTKNAYPRSKPVYAPNNNPESMENPGSTAAGGGWRAFPLLTNVVPSFGSHDGLGGRLMAIAQADTYDSSPNPWPAAGTWEQPGAAIAASQLVRLQPSTSAHMGLSMSTGAGPTMLYVAPPVFTLQTQPIIATGV